MDMEVDIEHIEFDEELDVTSQSGQVLEEEMDGKHDFISIVFRSPVFLFFSHR
jgi:hypothetical protein